MQHNMPNYVDTYKRPAFSWMEMNRGELGGGRWGMRERNGEGKDGEEAVAGMSNREMNK